MDALCARSINSRIMSDLLGSSWSRRLKSSSIVRCLDDKMTWTSVASLGNGFFVMVIIMAPMAAIINPLPLHSIVSMIIMAVWIGHHRKPLTQPGV